MLTSAGRIVIAQTTYVVVESREPSTAGKRTRFEYVNVLERSRLAGDFSKLEILDNHSLLLDYTSRHVRVTFGGGPENPEGMISELEAAIAIHSAGWRNLTKYANPHFLKPGNLERGSHGELLVAPDALVGSLKSILNAHLLDWSVNPAGYGRFSPVKVLLLDRMYVVADDIRKYAL